MYNIEFGKEIEAKDLLDSIATYNADPFCIEYEEDAEEVANFINNTSNYQQLTYADGYDWEVAMSQLGLNENDETKIIHAFWNPNEVGLTICFARD